MAEKSIEQICYEKAEAEAWVDCKTAEDKCIFNALLAAVAARPNYDPDKKLEPPTLALSFIELTTEQIEWLNKDASKEENNG